MNTSDGFDGSPIRSTATAAGFSGPSKPQSADVSARPALLSAVQAAKEVYSVSERTFHDMRARGLVPPPIVLGPRLLRWHRAELEAAIAAMPRRNAPAPMPSQLLRGKVERLKRHGKTASAGA